ncbi:hypothetical protein QBC42DRAFT_326601, partial [Cladorrhinum samala]
WARDHVVPYEGTQTVCHANRREFVHSLGSSNMSTTKKWFVEGILLLGSFVCVASAIRIVMMDQLVKSPDFILVMNNLRS